MTTIAWDGVSLAADKLANSLGTKRRCTKIFRCAHWVYGACGLLGEGEIVADLLRTGVPFRKWPTLDGENAIMGILVDTTNGRSYILEKKPWVMCPVEDRCHAEGGGRDAARAAMMCGKTAKEAVLIASKIDIATGLGVDVIRIKRKQ